MRRDIKQVGVGAFNEKLLSGCGWLTSQMCVGQPLRTTRWGEKRSRDTEGKGLERTGGRGWGGVRGRAGTGQGIVAEKEPQRGEGGHSTEEIGFINEAARQRKGKRRSIRTVRDQDPGAPGFPSARKGWEQSTRSGRALWSGLRGPLESDRGALGGERPQVEEEAFAPSLPHIPAQPRGVWSVCLWHQQQHREREADSG